MVPPEPSELKEEGVAKKERECHQIGLQLVASAEEGMGVRVSVWGEWNILEPDSGGGFSTG